MQKAVLLEDQNMFNIDDYTKHISYDTQGKGVFSTKEGKRIKEFAA